MQGQHLVRPEVNDSNNRLHRWKDRTMEPLNHFLMHKLPRSARLFAFSCAVVLLRQPIDVGVVATLWQLPL